MKIDLTKTEYRLLLDAVFIADWVLAAREGNGNSEDDHYQMLFQKLYSYAREMECGDLVAEDPEHNRYHLTLTYEEETAVFERIEDYNDVTFWEELLERLVERDMYTRTPEEDLDRLDDDEYWKRAAPYEEKYATELQNHGVDRLVIDEN